MTHRHRHPHPTAATVRSTPAACSARQHETTIVGGVNARAHRRNGAKAVGRALATVALVATAACHPGGADNPEVAARARDQALAPRPVRLVRPEVRSERPTLELVGEVRPFEMVTISSEVAGRVDRIPVEVGDRVAAGQPLVEVDRETFALALRQAEANLEAARAELALAVKELERKRDLVSDQTIPQAAFDQAEATRDLASARVAAAEAARDLARRDLDRSVVRSPSVGSVARRTAAPGQWTDVGEPLLELAAGDRVKVVARVPQGWTARLSGLDRFTFTVGGEQRSATVYSVDPVLEGASRSFEVTGACPASGLRPGMFVTVTLEAPEPVSSAWLPATAVSISDLPQVLTAADGTVVPRDVQTGRRDGAFVEIIAGVGPDEEVIADVSGLHRGLPVEVVP